MTIKTKILNFLTDQWTFGGVIEDFIRQTDGHKASNASRRCRELENEGKIESRIVVFQGRRVVQYRLKTPQNAPRAEISKNVAKILASWQKPLEKKELTLF